VIVATPNKRLTAHDKDGKLLFDGDIETPEQQQKVPAEVWEKVKPCSSKWAPSMTNSRRLKMASKANQPSEVSFILHNGRGRNRIKANIPPLSYRL